MRESLSISLNSATVSSIANGRAVKASDTSIVNFTVDPNAEVSATIFNKIQDAINAVPESNTGVSPYVIMVKNGTYVENLTLNKSWVTLHGESQNGVIVVNYLPEIIYLNDRGFTKFRCGSSYKNSTEYNPAILTVTNSTDCIIQNLIMKEQEIYLDMGPINVVTINPDSKRTVFKNCTMLGGQDTLFDKGRCYYYKCTIAGHVDFMYGPGTSVFDRCNIHSICFQRLYNLSEVKGLIPYGLSSRDLESRGITQEDINLWTNTDSKRIKYPDIKTGPNLRTSSTKPVDLNPPDFTRLLTAGELNMLSNEELATRQIARDDSHNPNNWDTIAKITASDYKRVKTTNGGHLTACNTDAANLGFLFINCTMTGDSKLSPSSVDLGRPWRPYSQITYVNCVLGPHIAPIGWNNWGNPDNEKTARYEEYGSMDADGNKLDLSKRCKWAKILNEDEVASRSPYSYLKGTDGWNPMEEISAGI